MESSTIKVETDSTSIEIPAVSPDAFDSQILRRRSSLKLARISSSKYRRALSKKVSLAADQKMKLRKLRSIRLSSFQNSRNYLRSTTCSNVKKVSSHQNPRNLESNSGGSDEIRTVLSTRSSASKASHIKSTTLKPVRLLTKMASFKTRRPSNAQDSSISRATCSSAIKGSKFLDQHMDGVELGCDLSKKISSAKVCSYSYCSLHGHRHVSAAASPTLMRVKSSRKRRSKRSENCLPRNFCLTQSSMNEEHNKEACSVFMEEHKESCHRVESDKKERKAKDEEPPRELESPDSNTAAAFGSSTGQQKYNVLWMLIYENVVSDIASNTSVQGNATSEAEFVEPNDMESDRHTNASTPDEQMRICQGDVVKLLQEALSKLLLAQRLDQSQDNQSVASDPNQSEASSPTEFKDAAKSDVSAPCEIKNDKGAGSREKCSLNRWSRLKKLILMKRFVKALEKTKKFNLKMPRSQTSELYPEAEKINLKHPSIKERKRSEEWMLDYALREVVSKLDPDQKRRVALLVDAFETLSPMQGGNYAANPNSSFASRSNCAQQEAMNCSLQHGERVDEGSSKILTGKASDTSPDRNSEFFKTEEQNPQTRSADPESFAIISENNPDWMAKELTDLDSDSGKYTSYGTDQLQQGPGSHIEGTNSVDVPHEGPDMSEGKEDMAEPLSRGPESADSYLDDSFGTKLGQRKNSRLWLLIYDHMVSDIEASSEGRLPVQGTAVGKTEVGDRVGELNDAVGFKGGSESELDTNASTPDESMEICQSDAVKLLQEALSKLLQQNPDQAFGIQSSANDGTVNAMPSPRVYEGAMRSEMTKPSGSREKQDRTEHVNERNDMRVVSLGCKSDQLASSNRWSRLKKLILLKRFVKALEKTKKFNPKLRRHQTLKVHPDEETVNLRHQSIEERKRSEEWMLDHALRKALSKLDPDQKRRVSLLVEAFEKVSPTQGCIPDVHSNSLNSHQSNCIQPATEQQNANRSSGSEEEILLGCVMDREPRTLVSENSGELKKEHGAVLGPHSMECMSKPIEVPDEGPQSHLTFAKLDKFSENVTVNVNRGTVEDSASSVSLQRKAPSLLEVHEPVQASDELPRPHSDNKRCSQLWYSVYRHMVSGLAAEENRENESAGETHTPRPHQVSQNQNADGMEFEKIEAVRLVQEAIDGILLSEVENGSVEAQSPNCQENHPDESTERDDQECRNTLMSEFAHSVESNVHLQIGNAEVHQKEIRASTTAGSKFSNGGAAKNWNNLKKVVLINRFLKSLDKVSNLNQQKPRRRLLQEEPRDTEEGVNLRHQDTDERRNAEEWMLDYALRRAVSKLTPARKMKVKLLVEAFETVRT